MPSRPPKEISDGEWHEIVLYMKRQSGYEVADGEARVVIDGQLVHTSTGVQWAEPGGSLPGDGVTGVYLSNMGMFTWFQNQIGVNGETTGGVIYTDNHTATIGIWPSPRYPRPW